MVIKGGLLPIEALRATKFVLTRQALHKLLKKRLDEAQVTATNKSKSPNIKVISCGVENELSSLSTGSSEKVNSKETMANVRTETKSWWCAKVLEIYSSSNNTVPTVTTISDSSSTTVINVEEEGNRAADKNEGGTKVIFLSNSEDSKEDFKEDSVSPRTTSSSTKKRKYIHKSNIRLTSHQVQKNRVKILEKRRRRVCQI